MTRRIEQVGELLRREIGTIVAREVDMERVLVTFTRIEVSKDVRYADMYFAAIPEAAAGKVLERLNSNIFLIQKSLNKRLRMRPVPQIRFHIDETEQEAAHIDELFERI